MRVLLDECVPRRFKNELSSHDCHSVPEAGLGGKKNGELLILAEQQGFEVFITLDKGIPYQQNLAGRQLAVVLIRAASNRLQDLLPHAAKCLQAIAVARPGSLTWIE